MLYDVSRDLEVIILRPNECRFCLFLFMVKMQKSNADQTRTFGPARLRDTSHYIVVASTNTQDTQGKVVSLQDGIFMLSFRG